MYFRKFQKIGDLHVLEQFSSNSVCHATYNLCAIVSRGRYAREAVVFPDGMSTTLGGSFVQQAIVITGASSGFDALAARELAKAGYTDYPNANGDHVRLA